MGGHTIASRKGRAVMILENDHDETDMLFAF